MIDLSGQDQSKLTAKSINQLGFSLYRELATQSNVVFSPLGITLGGIPKWIYLTIDRPFLFMLVDRESGLILFQGKVVNPLAG